MNAAIATAGALILYALGYLFYSKFLSEKIFGLRENIETPAHRFRDDVDYVPSSPWVLFGHHYASIAGLAPMLGPAVAVIWGWAPAMLWIVFGSLLIGCVHDLGALVVSLRARGMSIGKTAEGIIGKRAKTLFHIIILFLVSLAMGVFAYVIAFLFSPAKTAVASSIHFPQAVIPTFGMMMIAAAMGILGYRHKVSWKILAPIGFALTLFLTFLATNETLLAFTTLNDPKIWSRDLWMYILLTYAFLAAVLPVWTLLQPRDFLNSFLLYLGLGSMYAGFFILSPTFVAAPIIPNPPNAPGLFPFVFIIIACGAASGFHSLVSSGTTAKQLERETHARPIGYGGMIGESLLGLMAVLATTAGISKADWGRYYGDWSSVQGLGPKVAVFINGSATFLEALGISRELGVLFISLIVVSFALTSLDSATRLLRYNIEEIGESLKLSIFKNRYISGLAATAAIGFFAFYKIGGKSAGLALWRLFGTTNQLLAGLSLLVVTLYLMKRAKPWYYTGLPMIFLLSTTLIAAVRNCIVYFQKMEWPLFIIGTILILLTLWLVAEAAISIYKFNKEGKIINDPEIFADEIAPNSLKE